MGAVKQKCGNCKWALWELGPQGGRLKSVPGRCDYPTIPAPVLPECTRGVALNHLNRRDAIWSDDGTQCPTWGEREEVKQ